MSLYNRRLFRFSDTHDRVRSSFRYMQALDTDVYDCIIQEEQRQSEKLGLIASENCASNTVMEAAGTVFTDKYAEGYPGRRYYGGCEQVDILENLARDRAKKLFGAEYVNVQPHSGSNANMAIYLALLKPGDTVLGMDLANGGHLTHGLKANFSGKLYNIVSYGVSKDTEIIDYDEVEKLAKEHKPKLIIAGASAYSRIIDFGRFREIADSVNAFLMADMAHIAGLVAVELHPSPVPHAHFVTSTTQKTLRGPRGGFILMGKDTENSLGINSKSGEAKKWGDLVDAAVMPGLQGGPLMNLIAAKAVAFEEAVADTFLEYQRHVLQNASVLSARFTKEGIRVVSGGTENHLMILDLTDLDMTGKEAEDMLDKANIIVNKNTIPFDTRSPLVTSGIRIGTPAITTRGMVKEDMDKVGDFIIKVLKSKGEEKVIKRVAEAVREFTSSFPRNYP